ncbi:hypothetical protein SKAU_G00387130 [Synaphobranchus kaupii]|uniref:CCHC-type domain-containing protein n=1 Tax=Synaphobranchus kaupii TaxID=118154 RepID=A0A9Q1ID92_SYNKA|nr:hypothetical protein SKAU_G00387130 [Synaphobranchus kaupii]
MTTRGEFIKKVLVDALRVDPGMVFCLQRNSAEVAYDLSLSSAAAFRTVKKRKCRAFGHLADVCKEEVRCRNCNEVGHAAQACPNPKKCHACGSADHLFRECPGTARTYAEAAAGRPGPSVSQELTKEGQGPEQREQTEVEVETSEPLVAPAQQAGGSEEGGVENMVERMKKVVAGLGKGRRDSGREIGQGRGEIPRWK